MATMLGAIVMAAVLAQAGDRMAVPPPFVPGAGAGGENGVNRSGRNGSSFPPPYTPGGRQFLVQPGQDWAHIRRELQPGDEVIFPAGFHLPQKIEGLSGTRDKPIVLRSRDPIAGAVSCADTSLILGTPPSPASSASASFCACAASIARCLRASRSIASSCSRSLTAPSRLPVRILERALIVGAYTPVSLTSSSTALADCLARACS